MSEPYDTRWDTDPDAFKRKIEEWDERDWMQWLEQHLTFPFEVERVEDDASSFFTDVAEREPLRAGHRFQVLALELDDHVYGVIVEVREGRARGYVPLADLEVTSAADPNYWPVREYVVWFANR